MYILPFSSVCNIWSFHFFYCVYHDSKFFFSDKAKHLWTICFPFHTTSIKQFFFNLLYIHNIIQTLVLKFPSDLILFLSCSFLFLSLLCCFRTPASLRLLVSAIPPLLVAFPLDAAFESPARPLRSWASGARLRPARRREEVRALLVYILTDNEWNLRYSTKQKGQRRGRESKTDQQHRFSLRNDTRVALPAVLLFDMLEVRELGRRDLHAHVRHGLAAPLDGWTQSIPGEREHMKKVHLSAKRGRKIWKWENELIKILIGD